MPTNNYIPTLFLSDFTRRRLLAKLDGATSRIFTVYLLKWEMKKHEKEAREQLRFLASSCGFSFTCNKGSARLTVDYDISRDTYRPVGFSYTHPRREGASYFQDDNQGVSQEQTT